MASSTKSGTLGAKARKLVGMSAKDHRGSQAPGRNKQPVRMANPAPTIRGKVGGTHKGPDLGAG